MTVNLLAPRWKKSFFLLGGSGAFQAVIDEMHIFYGSCIRSNKELSSSVSIYKWYIDPSKYHAETEQQQPWLVSS